MANPFVNKTRVLAWHQVLKCIVMGLTVFPIRGLIVFLIIVFAASVSVIGTMGMRPEDFDTPLPRWRVWLLAPLRPSLRAVLFVGGMWIEVRGEPAPKAEAPIVISNHRCFIESLYFMAVLNGNAVAAAKYADIPLIGVILIALQNILVRIDKREPPRQDQQPGAGQENLHPAEPSLPSSVPLPTQTTSGASSRLDAATWAQPVAESTDEASPFLPQRSSPFSALPSRSSAYESASSQHVSAADSAVAKIMARAADSRFGRVLIFPEGTCGNGDVLLSFKTGAFKPGLPVQPVTVEYPFRYFDVSWCSEYPGLGDIVCRMFCQLYTPMVVTYYEVIKPTPEERANPMLYARNVQEFMAKKLNVQPTSHSYDDYLLSQVAREARFPPEIGVIEFQKLRGVLNMDIKTAEKYLQLFMLADTERTGRISADQFAEIFMPAATATVDVEEVDGEPTNLSTRRALHRLFALLDLEGNGWLNYREFLIGLSIVNERSRAGGRSDALRMAFKIIDVSGRGAISREEFRGLLLRAWPEMGAGLADAAFDSADADHDGYLTAAEFVAWGDAEESGGLAASFRRAYMGFSREPELLQPPAVRRDSAARDALFKQQEGGLRTGPEITNDGSTCDLFPRATAAGARRKGGGPIQ